MAVEPEITIEGLDVIDVLKYIGKKRNKFLALILAELESTLDKNSEEYKVIRKVILDGVNDYTRSLLRILFGNVEGMIMK
jgi:hypothetical protein